MKPQTQAQTQVPERLARLEDRLAIEDLQHHYATMVDRRQWEQMDEVFAPGATIDYRSTGGQSGPYRKTLEWLDRALEPWPLNLHFITNLRIRFDPQDSDRAQSVCYFFAPMGRVEGDGQLVITNAGRYEDELVRVPHGWRIATRHCDQSIMIGALPEGYEIPE